jgi:hypothetical protein
MQSQERLGFFIWYSCVLLSGCVAVLTTTLTLLRTGASYQSNEYINFLTHPASYASMPHTIPPHTSAYTCGPEKGVLQIPSYTFECITCAGYPLYATH